MALRQFSCLLLLLVLEEEWLVSVAVLTPSLRVKQPCQPTTKLIQQPFKAPITGYFPAPFYTQALARARTACTHKHTHTAQEHTNVMALRQLSCLLLLLVLVSGGLAQTTCTNTDPCVLDCTSCSPGEKVPDPDNCRGYYLCLDGSGPDSYYDTPYECGPSEVFNATIHECVEGLYCESCDTALSCAYECPAQPSATVNISSFSDCHYYYQCHEDGSVTPAACDDATPFFDGQECQTDETRCCHCHVYCPATASAGDFVRDPLDCRRYYLCTEPGTVPILGYMCEEGMNFDSFLQDCSDSVACVTQCTNVVDADGCIEPYTCLTTGYFPRCPDRCTPDYYHCAEATGEYQDGESCEDETVFHPDTHTCVSYTDCP